MIISLIGMMGCGKSSVGRELSERLCCPFIDLDSYIETHEGRSIPEIFRESGEDHFRSLELKALREVVSEWDSLSANLVLALGGGTPTREECAKILSEKTICIFLKASRETILSHLEGTSAASRPMLKTSASSSTVKKDPAGSSTVLKNPAGSSPDSACVNNRLLEERVSALLAQREEIYEKTARHTIVTDGLGISEIVGSIENHIFW